MEEFAATVRRSTLLEASPDSLFYSVRVARLKDEAALEPLSDGGDIEFPLTLPDFIGINRIHRHGCE